ncbi:MAG: hypothetical protein LKI92_00890 [Schleiferilactobacillus harbinensis]|jgi:hypothetical protein|nr:hypothetical protein [Schleiferilactobacillus harbinensis]MCI1914003.1 hypothetical protein [Schleiferilactobacillus harbinensis]
MNQLNVQLLNASNYYQIITDLISKYCSITNLGVVAGLFVGVLLPVVILLLESVSENVWDRAVLLQHVIEFKHAFIGIGLISVTLLLWTISAVRVPLLLSYAIGMAMLIRILILSLFWLSDWNEDYPNGVRYRWRKNILTNRKLTTKQRLKVWTVYLQSISRNRNSEESVFSNREQFVYFFKSNYQDNKMDQLDLLQITSQYTESVFKSPGSREDEFLSFGFSEFFALGNSIDDRNLSSLWDVLLEHERKEAAKNEIRTWLLFYVVDQLTPTEIRQNSAKVFTRLANIICDSLWERNNGSADEQLLAETPWRITASDIEKDNVQGHAQLYLLRAFWKKVDDVEQQSANNNDVVKNGIKLDNLVKVLFANADPILLGQLYELFDILVTPPYESDWSEYLFDRLNRKPLFGYIGRVYDTWSEKDPEGEKNLYESQRKQQDEESIAIAVKSFLRLRYPVEGKRYVEKVQETLNSEEFHKFTESPTSKIDKKSIIVLNNITQSVLRRI